MSLNMTRRRGACKGFSTDFYNLLKGLAMQRWWVVYWSAVQYVILAKVHFLGNFKHNLQVH